MKANKIIDSDKFLPSPIDYLIEFDEKSDKFMDKLAEDDLITLPEMMKFHRVILRVRASTNIAFGLVAVTSSINNVASATREGNKNAK